LQCITLVTQTKPSTNQSNSRGGVVTIDIWMDWNAGTSYDPAQIEALRSMGFASGG